MTAPPYYGTPAHSPERGTVDNVPREALRVVLALAAREVERRQDGMAASILARAIQQVREAYDAEPVEVAA